MKPMLTTLLGATVQHCATRDIACIRLVTYVEETGDFRLLVERKSDHQLLSWSYENCNVLRTRKRRP